MLQGDPQLDRVLRAENRKAGRWRRRLFVVVMAMLVAIVGWGILTAVTTPTVEAQPPSPEPPPRFGVAMDALHPRADEQPSLGQGGSP